jgi:hypothetical protein
MADTNQQSQREESERERLERNMNELLQELRVAQAGVQILFAFLLTVAFTPVFQNASSFVRGLHLITVLLAAGSAALITAPAAWHRVLFRRGRRAEILAASNRFAITGLVLLAGAMACTVMLVAFMVLPGWPAVLIGVLAGIVFFAMWFAMPARLRHAHG